ncbi:hypothetical protein NIES4103_31380 [Nostoc sp. NIES-4103]|nr:hypothetical protein NIES4103_31380 [Nostoc sp. NIES-4103]
MAQGNKTLKQLRQELLDLIGDPHTASTILCRESLQWYKETCHLPPPKEPQDKLILQRAIDRIKQQSSEYNV